MDIDRLKHDFFELTPDAVAIGRVSSCGKSVSVQCVNDAFARLSGRSKEAVLGEELAEFCHGSTLTVFRDALKECLANGTGTFTADVRLAQPDGASTWVSMSCAIWPDEAGTSHCLTASCRSIAALKTAQNVAEKRADALAQDLRLEQQKTAELTAVRTRIGMALDAYPDPIVVYGSDLKLFFWNEGYATSITDNPDDLVEGMHLKDVLLTAVRYGRYPDAIGNEDAWVENILSANTLERSWEDVELEGDVHHRLMRSRSAVNDYMVIRLNSTELVRQKRNAEAAQSRLLAALNAYPSPFAIYDQDDCLVVWNDAYCKSMSNDPDGLKIGMHRLEAARVAVQSGKIAEAIGREEEFMSAQHLDSELDKPVQDLELAGDVHHRLLRSRVANGDLVLLRIDTTEIVRQRRALEHTQERLMSAINAFPDPFSIYDADMKLQIWNPAHTQSVTDDPDELYTGIPFKEVLRLAAKNGRIPEAVGRVDEWLESYYSPALMEPKVQDVAFANDQHYRIVCSRSENNESVFLCLNVTATVRSRRSAEEYARKLEVANQAITYKALHDDLTGLGNRRHLSDRFDQLVKQRQERGGEIAALHIDLDRFKQINDTMGHAAGDQVLLDTSKRIHQNLRDGDVVARTGGDEFVILLYVEESSDRPEQLAQTLLRELAVPTLFEGKECRFGASIGLARTPLAEVDELLTNSDVALYKAKRQGRGVLGTFDHSDLEEVRKNKTLADDLLRAIERREFVPFYQPQVDAVSGRVVGLEALARWDHPTKGIIAPDGFLPIATDLNISADIDKMIFERAIKECQSVIGQWTDPPSLSFNVSVNRVRREEFQAIHQHVESYSGRVCFELLETIFLEEEDQSFLFELDRLRDIGVGIEVDDFGSGRASVVALQRIGPERLKIDRRIVAHVAESDSGLRLVRSMVEIGHALEMGVTAEGVETTEQAEILASLGCDRLQGYLFAKPMAYSDVLAFLDRQAAPKRRRS